MQALGWVFDVAGTAFFGFLGVVLTFHTDRYLRLAREGKMPFGLDPNSPFSLTSLRVAGIFMLVLALLFFLVFLWDLSRLIWH